MNDREDRSRKIRDIIFHIPPFEASTECDVLQTAFRSNEDVDTFAIVESGKPVGLIARYQLANILSQGYGRELYAHRPISKVMDPNPLIVDCDMDVADVKWLIAEVSPNALKNGFVVTRKGHYFGVGTALLLLKDTVGRQNERTHELNAARVAAEEANLAKSRFLAAMSHELRTPLNAIIGFSEIIAENLLGNDLPRYTEYAKDVNHSAKHLLSLISDILDLSRIEEGKTAMQFEPIALADFCSSSLRMVSDTAAGKHITLPKPKIDKNIYLLADERGLRQILLNLVTNAIKYTEPGGGVSVEVIRQSNGEIELCVIDTGCGMTQAEIQKALEPFGRADNPLVRENDGYGLGLPIVLKLVELHGAMMTIDSRVAEGTSVRVCFPANRVITQATAV